VISLIFLGTGGGRFTTISQARATGGMYLYSDSTRVHIDPGPGALLQLRTSGLDPTKTTALVVTHCHPDHCADAMILVEAMTHGCKKKRGILAGSDSVMNGYENLGPAISKYHASKPAQVKLLKPNSSIEVDHLNMRAIRTYHSDPTGIGLRISSPDGQISITGDTSLKEEIYREHSDCDVLVMSVTRPLRARIPYHLSTEDAAALAEVVEPKLAILTHFGMKFIAANPETQARWVEKQTGVKTIAAWDGMSMVMRDSIPLVQKTISRQFVDSKKLSVELDE